MSDKAVVTEVQKLSPKPGDVVHIHTENHHWTPEMMESLRETLADIDCKVLVTNGDTRITLIEATNAGDA